MDQGGLAEEQLGEEVSAPLRPGKRSVSRDADPPGSLSSFLHQEPQPRKALLVLLGPRSPGSLAPSLMGKLPLSPQSRSGPWEAKEPVGQCLGANPTRCNGGGHSHCIQGSPGV